MDSNVRDIAERNARRVTHLGRVLFLGDCGFRGSAELRNLSTTGCQMMSEGSLQIGMELQLSIEGASDQSNILIEMAKVRWTIGNCYGLEFLAIDPLERERLRIFLKTK
jgi:c-di-GMP-binding flagellar brake protein YcgR